MSKFKRYERYKDSGVEWLGEIPEHWEVKKIKYLANVINVKASDSDNNKTYIGLENIESKTGKLLVDDIDEQQVIEGTSNVFEKNDVLFSKLRPYLAKCLIADFSGRCTSELLVLRCKGILPKYMFFFMLSPKFIDVVNSSTYGTKMPRANWDFIGNLKIPLPSQEEQKSIIEYLSKKCNEIDALIEDKEKLIELLQEKRQTIITEAVTKGLNPNARMKDSGIEWIGEIPEHWNLRRIRYLANIRNVKASDSDIDKTYVGLENIESKTGKLLTNGDDEQQFVGETANIFKKGDVLFGKLRPYLAKCIIADFDGRCTSELLVLKTTSYILPKYLHFFMLSPKFIDVVNSSTYGAKMPRASWDFIGNLEIPLPSIKEQEDIVEYLTEFISRIDDLISDINTQIQKLKEYRQSLISEAVTGKIDVRDYVVSN